MLKQKKVKNKKGNYQSGVNEWLPIEDVGANYIKRKDKKLVAVLKIEPMNIMLRSEAEKRRVINAVHEVINGVQYHFQIMALPRPVDLDKYLEFLEEKIKEIDVGNIKKKILRDYTQYITSIARSGEALERRYYILVWEEEKNGREELIKKAYELASNLGNSGLKVSLCDDLDIIDMLFSFLHPLQSAYEEVPLGDKITLYREVNS